EDGSFYIVQELLRGTSLREYLQPARQARRRLTPANAIEIVVPIMGALAAAHAVNVVHRDVKPENIVLSRLPSGQIVPKLIDFGIAKMLHSARDSLANPDTP